MLFREAAAAMVEQIQDADGGFAGCPGPACPAHKSTCSERPHRLPCMCRRPRRRWCGAGCAPGTRAMTLCSCGCRRRPSRSRGAAPLRHMCRPTCAARGRWRASWAGRVQPTGEHTAVSIVLLTCREYRPAPETSPAICVICPSACRQSHGGRQLLMAGCAQTGKQAGTTQLPVL